MFVFCILLILFHVTEELSVMGHLLALQAKGGSAWYSEKQGQSGAEEYQW